MKNTKHLRKNKMRNFLLTLTLLTAPAFVAQAQTPSGLLTGPVSYVSTLTAGNPYGDSKVWLVQNPDGTTYTCAANVVNQPNCFIVKYVNSTEYSKLVASDGTGNCYIWDVWQLDTGGCQSSFHGGAPGEYGALYCSGGSTFDANGNFNLNCQATWGGTAINVIGGVDVPIPTVYIVNVNIKHHTVRVWIPAVFRTPGHWENWQQIDSMTVGVTPIS